jgi:putative membrane protein
MSKTAKGLLIAGGVILALLVVGLVVWGFVGTGSGYYYRGWMGPGMMGGFGGWGGWGIMAIAMLVFWGLVIWGIIALARSGDHHHQVDSSRGNDSALEILKRRYASGEITKDEYEQKKKDLLS